MIESSERRPNGLALGASTVEQLSLDEFIAFIETSGALGDSFWLPSANDIATASLDSIATLELLVMLDDLGIAVDFTDAGQLSTICDLRSLYLAVLTWNQMP